jgi:hypothetical protein
MAKSKSRNRQSNSRKSRSKATLVGKSAKRNGPSAKFASQLRAANLSPSSYLSKARSKARTYGVSASRLQFSDDATHKLMITDDAGTMTRFGAVGYGDYILYKQLERVGKVEDGTAQKKRSTFQTSHRAISGNWKSNKYSANNLALHILW